MSIIIAIVIAGLVAFCIGFYVGMRWITWCIVEYPEKFTAIVQQAIKEMKEQLRDEKQKRG